MIKRIGAEYKKGDRCQFCVWAPFSEMVEVIIKGKKEAFKLIKDEQGYWQNSFSGIEPGTLYKFRLDSQKDLPDPASHSQPFGVHSWSEVVDPDFKWEENGWKAPSVSQLVIYELHVGTFSPQGTFPGIIEKLDHLLDLGITAIELMPVAQFPGTRNWGYDGVFPFAVQNSYGGSQELKNLVNSCHQKRIAVFLDVVYNHLGPEGNYLREFGPYFTEKYHTPWGAAINFDDKYCDGVRNFFLSNAMRWLEEFRFDGLRLDAVHEIIDRGAKHFLKELSERKGELEKQTNRSYLLVAETDQNNSQVVSPYTSGGFDLEAQWLDDFHHSLHTVLTGEKNGYYSDFGSLSHLAKAYKQGYVYDGTYSDFRKRSIGNSPKGLSPKKFVVCTQNHDQVGNRLLGDRLTSLVSFEELKLAAAAVLISPFVPMLFMGEEYGEENPFLYFVSHGDENLVKAVQEGRKKEFQYFFQHHHEDFPDPQAEKTFKKSKLNWDFKKDRQKRTLFQFYKHLLDLRKRGVLERFGKPNFTTGIDEAKKVLFLTSNKDENDLVAFLNFNENPQAISLPGIPGHWKLLFASGDKAWGGTRVFPRSFESGEGVTIPGSSIIICES